MFIGKQNLKYSLAFRALVDHPIGENTRPLVQSPLPGRLSKDIKKLNLPTLSIFIFSLDNLEPPGNYFHDRLIRISKKQNEEKQIDDFINSILIGEKEPLAPLGGFK